ncbi:MAG: iron-sulfur cluster assembly scaffold protein [Candidatus Nanohaloarchaea archaeon]
MMYREEILDLYRKPLNEGSLEDALEAEGENPSCGDSTTVYVDVEDDVVEEIRHETDACAIATASISIASDELAGKGVEEVLNLEKDWIMDRLGSDISPMRVKCAVLGLKTVQSALSD